MNASTGTCSLLRDPITRGCKTDCSDGGGEPAEEESGCGGWDEYTKRKNQRLEKAVIGSSSTWKEEQLELFRVTLSDPTSAKEMIPDKWFEFSGLADYQAGITSCVLTDCSSGRTSIDPTF